MPSWDVKLKSDRLLGDTVVPPAHTGGDMFPSSLRDRHPWYIDTGCQAHQITNRVILYDTK